MARLDNVSRDMRILIVDDFSTMRRIVKNVLLQLGFTNIDEAEDGKEALGKLRSGDYEFVISDWNMPRMMGIDLLREVRKDSHLRTLPFLMVTAETQYENLEEAVQAGVSSYITKPFTLESLEQKLQQIFSPSSQNP